MSEHVSTFRPGYPGGMSTKALRREAARKAGKASGRARRQRSTCKRPPRLRSRQDALALRYPIRQVGHEEFEQLYAAMCEREEIPFDRRGLHTAHELYKQQLTAFRVQGQDWETTNTQIARGLELRGRARCRRTVQRTRKRLEAMKLVGYSHVRRSGALCVPGQMDTLRVRCLCPRRANVTPPSGAGASPFGAQLAPALPAEKTALAPPPSAADDVGLRCAEPGSDGEQAGTDAAGEYETEDERRFAFLSMLAEHAPAMLSVADRQELERLRRRLGGSGQATALTDSIAWEGER